MSPNQSPELQDPELQFAEWFDEAFAHSGEDASRCFIATVSEAGQPSVRVVFHRPGTSRRLRFFTNYQSRKGTELSHNPRAAATFHWPHFQRQVRLEGTCHVVSASDSDAYFAARARDSQLAALLSPQSRRIDSIQAFRERHQQQMQAAAGAPLARPPHWGGYELVPHFIEFWVAGHGRMHERAQWTRAGGVWQCENIAP
jgi:pyridoxamine 5'-phosphate oxidase